MSQLLLNQILQGDVLDHLKKLQPGQIDCVIFSPPFYDARDYGVDGQWGLEKDSGMYLDRMAQLMRHLWRVIKHQGTVWVEIGDKTDESGSWQCLPEEFLQICRMQGWIVVSKVIWFKRNAMPLSTKKRWSPKYTFVYGFAKSKEWYFDLDAARIPPKTKSSKFNLRVREAKNGRLEKKYGRTYSATEEEKQLYDKSGIRKQDRTPGPDGKPLGHYEGFNGRYDHGKIEKQGKNPGDFWEFMEEYPNDIFDITVKKNPDFHYATFPVDLPERIIRACCPSGGTVLDPFMGSGTTAIAAEEVGRNWLGIELSAENVAKAMKRIEESRTKIAKQNEVDKP